MFTLSWESEDPGLFTWKQTNMEQTERDQLLGRKKHLEDRIAEHEAIIDRNLKDKEAKLPDFRERLEKVRAIITDAEKNLAEVNRQLT